MLGALLSAFGPALLGKLFGVIPAPNTGSRSGDSPTPET